MIDWLINCFYQFTSGHPKSDCTVGTSTGAAIALCDVFSQKSSGTSHKPIVSEFSSKSEKISDSFYSIFYDFLPARSGQEGGLSSIPDLPQPRAA